MKQDYIQGYLDALMKIFNRQVLTNGYEIALQIPVVVEKSVQELNLVTGKDISHKIKDYEAYNFGYKQGLEFKNHERLSY